MESKAQLRKDNKAHRKSMSAQEVKTLSLQVIKRILKHKCYINTDCILAYSAIQNEVDLSGLINAALRDNKKVFLPRVDGEDIFFYRIYNTDEYDALTEGSFNISEPQDMKANLLQNQIDASDSCTVLIPGIGFSTTGQRIGFGKGFYDRFLAKHLDMLKIGICYDWQITREFESDVFDINMDMIISEKREVKTNDRLREHM